MILLKESVVDKSKRMIAMSKKVIRIMNTYFSKK